MLEDGELKPSLRPMHSLLIQKEQVRGGRKPSAEPKTNQHVIIEFALQV